LKIAVIFINSIDQNLAQKAIGKYKHWVGFFLARLIPYERQYLSQFEHNKRFIEACEQYGLSISEGISSVLSCYKIGKMQDGAEIIVWRQTQGYDPKE
jgi:hypothetical protein